MKREYRTNSTDHVVESDKYVQAGGLFIFGFLHTKTRLTETEVEGTSGGYCHQKADFLSEMVTRL